MPACIAYRDFRLQRIPPLAVRRADEMTALDLRGKMSYKRTTTHGTAEVITYFGHAVGSRYREGGGGLRTGVMSPERGVGVRLVSLGLSLEIRGYLPHLCVPRCY